MKSPESAPGWNVKVYELHQNQSESSAPEYKTFFIHPESTVFEVLASILKKWRIIDTDQLGIVSKGTRLIMSSQAKNFIIK